MDNLFGSNSITLSVHQTTLITDVRLCRKLYEELLDQAKRRKFATSVSIRRKMISLGFQMTREELEKLAKDIRVRQETSKLTWKDFVDIIERAEINQHFVVLFQKADKDEDGLVTGNELTVAFDELCDEGSYYIVPKFRMLAKLVQTTIGSTQADLTEVKESADVYLLMIDEVTNLEANETRRTGDDEIDDDAVHYNNDHAEDAWFADNDRDGCVVS